jgi:catechol 2,3-dioxygenase-like lactoylglutathione lyase family enzyme
MRVVLCWCAVAALRAQAPAPGQPLVDAVAGVAFTVSDLTRATQFFVDVLEFTPQSTYETDSDDGARLAGVFGLRAKHARLRLGQEQVELTEFLAPRGRAYPSDTKGNDLWFQHIAIIVSDMDRAYARLRAHGVAHASSAPQTLPAWNENAGGIRAFYFRDPDGHFLELLQFPAGKGDARWQSKDALFLGIDHTAITVADTEASLAFYRDTLGMVVAGTSENWGPEQEQLNGVFGARLRITALRAGRGPAIELLEYLAPGPGRTAPPDLAGNDLAHWHVVLRTRDVDAAFAALKQTRTRFVSPGPVGSEGTRALGARDPDGHVMQLHHAPVLAR